MKTPFFKFSKSVSKFILSAIALFVVCSVMAQRPKAVVLNFDTKNVGYDPVQMGNLVRIELEKLDTFSVMDRYDQNFLIEKNGLNINNCYGKICLVEIGKTLGADKMLTGSVESFGDAIVYTMRLIDVKNDMIEAAQVTEFLAIPNELQTMTAVMLKQLFKKKIDPNVLSQLIRPDGYDARTREPVAEQIRLDGPRMGAAYFTGMAGKILQAPKSEGGYDVYPVMFQFGYQFEKQYLASGQFQALFEFIPMITGLDQGLFIPSLTLMNGMRANKYGIELGFGPTFAINRTSRGFYDRSGNWHLSHEYNSLQDPTFIPTYVERMDSRGSCKLNTAFVFAVGKTFRSGNMNIPVNAFFVPGRNGWRVGLSLGYNIRYRRK